MNTTLANTCCYRMRNSNNRSDDSIPRGSIYVRSIYLDMIEPQSKRRSMQIILLNTRRRLRSALVHNDGSIYAVLRSTKYMHTIYAHNVYTQYMHTCILYRLFVHNTQGYLECTIVYVDQPGLWSVSPEGSSRAPKCIMAI